MSETDPIRRNRDGWNRTSDGYQERHGRVLEDRAEAWGVWRIPESGLRVLGEVAGRDVLEFGCGAAQWSAALSQRGARAVGFDLSERQLAHARQHLGRHRLDLPLVQADGERLPFRDASFDVVFCDHGAMSFADPERTVGEAARVLRPGGLFAFCMSTPLLDVCWDPGDKAVAERLVGDYFAMSCFPDDETVTYQLQYGEWIRLFRHHALVVEDLIELRPPPTAETTYADYVPHAWARKWPAEHIWKVRKGHPRQ